MNAGLKKLLGLILILSLTLLIFASLETQLQSVTKVSNLILHLGAVPFVLLMSIALLPHCYLLFTRQFVTRRSFILLMTISLGAVIMLANPITTKSAIDYFRADQRYTRFVERFEHELQKTPEYNAIDLTYHFPPNAQFPHLSVSGNVRSKTVYNQLLQRIESRIDGSVFWHVTIDGN